MRSDFDFPTTYQHAVRWLGPRLTGFDSLRDLLLVQCIVTEGSLHFLGSQRESSCRLGGGMAAEIITHDDPYWCAFVADEGFFTEVGIGVPCGTVMWC